MKPNTLLTIASLLSILLLTLHLTEDYLHEGGMTRGGFYVPMVVLTGWLYGTLMLSERRSGYVIMLIGSIFAFGMGIIHTMVRDIGKGNGFFFIWTILALGVTGLFSFILCIRGLWSLRRVKSG